VDLVFLFGSRRFSQLSVSSFAQPMSLHSNDCRHTVVNELPLRSRIPNENSDEHGMGQEDGLATSRRDTALIAAICAAPAKGAPRKWPENCLKIAENEVLHGSPIWDFLSTGKKSVFKAYFHFPSRESGSGFELELGMPWLSNPCCPKRVFLSRTSQSPMLLW
jgi:hypothetical protein